jgi:hypothetical protein
VQAVEIGPAVDAEQHSLAVDHEGRIAVAQRGLGDQRIAIAPVVAVGVNSRTRLSSRWTIRR